MTSGPVHTHPHTPVARRLVGVFVSAYISAWVAAALVAALGLHGAAAAVITVFLFAIGIVAGWITSRTAGPWSAADVRDGALGWGIVAAIVLALPCFLLPMPWAVVAVAAELAVVALTVRAVRGTVREDPAG